MAPPSPPLLHASSCSANVTAYRPDASSVLVEGSLEAHIRVGATAATERVTTDFDTVLLYSANRGGGGKSGVNIEEATEYDDEVRRGQVLSLTSFQYLSDKTPQ
jgi:hypothetical protein